MFSGFEIAVHDADRVRLGQRAAHFADDLDDLGGGHPADAVEPLAELLAVEQLHGDVRRAVEDAVVEDLHDVRATERCGRLRLALEARLRLGHLRKFAFDEFHRAGDVETEVGRVPDRPHTSLPELAIELEALCDDNVRCELHGGPRKSPRTDAD